MFCFSNFLDLFCAVFCFKADLESQVDVLLHNAGVRLLAQGKGRASGPDVSFLLLLISMLLEATKEWPVDMFCFTF